MHQAVELPLDADLAQAAVGEAIQAFITAQVAKDRFDVGQAARVEGAGFGSIDLLPHAGGERARPLAGDGDGERTPGAATRDALAFERTLRAGARFGTVATVMMPIAGAVAGGLER